MITKAVIPAAGLGTRFLPVTKSMPKEMLPIIDKPIIQFAVEEAIASGIEDIIIITGRGKRAIEDYFDTSPELESHLVQNKKYELLQELKDISSLVDIHYIRQKEPKGLGDAVLKAEKHIGAEPFAVLLGDDIIKGDVPCIKQLMDVYAYKFKGKRYDAGDKLGYVKAIVDFALEREDLKEGIKKYLRGIVGTLQQSFKLK